MTGVARRPSSQEMAREPVDDEPHRDQLRAPDPSAVVGAVALVTGGGRGIGRDVALALSACGASVVVADIDETAAERVATEARQSGFPVLAVRTDVSNESDVETLIAHIAGRFGRLDVAVNNAGVIHVDSLLETDLSTWRRIFAVNLDGTFLVTRAAARLMLGQGSHPRLRRRGLILTISSRAGELPRPEHVAYGASKAAINYLARTCAEALAADAVSSVVLYPGNVREGMWRDLGERLAAVQQRSREAVEAERPFQPSTDVAAAVRDIAATPGMALNGRLVLDTRRIVDI